MRIKSNRAEASCARLLVHATESLREAREGALRSAAGRDLVVAKADVIEEELAELGLQLRARSRSHGARVLRKQFEAGQKAGLGFSYTPGLQHDKRDA